MSTRINVGHVSTQASVTIQATHDVEDMRNRRNYVGYTHKPGETVVVYDAPLGDAPLQGIHTNELVYQSISSRVPKSFLSKNAQPVLSALNGLFCHHKQGEAPVSEEQKIAELSRKIRFVGVACTDTYFGDQANTQTQVTVRTRGTHTILNNSTVPINFGDIVMWKIPTAEERKQLDAQRKERHTGTLTYAQANENIVQLMTVPYNHNRHDISAMTDDTKIDELHAKLTSEVVGKPQSKSSSAAAAAQKTAAAAETKKLIKDMINDHISHELASKEDVHRRIIGKALSHAKPGHTFDILLL
jgi:hypothetical protein